MACHSVVTLWGKTKWLLLQSPRTEFFKLVELLLEDGLEMAEHSIHYTGGDCTVTVDSCCGHKMYVFECNLTK